MIIIKGTAMISANPRLLLVEDSDSVRRDLAKMFRKPRTSMIEHHTIARFDVDEAETGAEAHALLRRSVKERRPYDVVILDLGLRQGQKDDRDIEDPQVGMTILKEVLEFNQLMGGRIIICTQHDEPETVISTFRGGAADFVAKPWKPEAMEEAVIRAYRSSRKLSRRAWRRFRRDYLLKQMQAWISRECQVDAFERFGRVVFEGFRVVLERIGRLEQHLKLADLPDEGNAAQQQPGSISAQLEDLRCAVFDTMDGCLKLPETTELDESPPLKTISVGDIIEAVIDDLGAGIAYKRLLLEVDGSQREEVCAFEPDLKAIVDAMLFQAINLCRTRGRLSVHNGRRPDGTLAISVECEERNGCPPDMAKNRALSLARRLAHNIGGRIEIVATARGSQLTLAIGGGAATSPAILASQR